MGDQVIFQLHMGVHIAPLQVEEIQGVAGIVRQGIGTRIQKRSKGFSLFCAVYRNLAGREIDVHRSRVMDAPQVRHQHAVYKHPYVVVSAEFIDDRVFTYFSAVQLNKAGRHMHAEIVVDGCILGTRRIHQAGDRIGSGGVEWEEVPFVFSASIVFHARMIIQHKGIIRLVIDRIVLVAIVVIIAIFVHLQEALHVGIAGLTAHLYVRVKQIGQGLVAVLCGEVRIKRVGQIQLGIAVIAQSGFYDALIGLIAFGPLVPLPNVVFVPPHPFTEE